ncbi:MAG TPA: hypothetical protein PKZ36_03020 [Candidatus Paceibacterota bacterium]|nr:hypothetical protein [Candidatus Paceibacterota bacterium]HPT18351.1 hypothetical protein [Candidatus Paceibacterota bacterium]
MEKSNITIGVLKISKKESVIMFIDELKETISVLKKFLNPSYIYTTNTFNQNKTNKKYKKKIRRVFPHHLSV